MFKIKTFVLLIFCFAMNKQALGESAYLMPPDAQEAPHPAATTDSALAPLVTYDECWHILTKKAAQGFFEGSINDIFSDLKDRSYVPEAILSAPRTVELTDFGLTSMNASAGHLLCNVWVTAVIKSDKYGKIVVPASPAFFDISQSEGGPVITAKNNYFTPFMKAFSKELKKLGIDLPIHERSNSDN